MSIETKREEFDAEQSRAAELVEERLDDTLRAVFRKYEHELPTELAGLDADLERMVTSYLTAIGAAFDRSEMPGRVALRIRPEPMLPGDYRNGGEVAIGDARDLRDGDVLHTSHSLVRAAIDEARAACCHPFQVRIGADDQPLPERLAGLQGRRGYLVVTKIAYRGIEPVDQIITTGLLEGSVEPLAPETVEALLSLGASDDGGPGSYAPPAALEDAVKDAVLENQNATTNSDRDRYERLLRQLDRYVEDQARLLRRRQADFEEKIDEAERRRERALTAAGRAKEEEGIASYRRQIEHLSGRIATLERGDDPDYQLWRGRLHERRFRKPQVERILEVAFEIAGAES